MRIKRIVVTGLFVAAGVVLITPGLMAQTRLRQLSPAEQDASGRQAKQVEANALRQVNAFESRLKLEEQRMDSRFKQLARMREIALKQNDAAALKRVEALEQQAVQQYDARVQQILKGYDATVRPNGQRSGARRPSSLKSAGGQTGATKRVARAAGEQRVNEAKKQRPSRSRRFRLWPFSS